MTDKTSANEMKIYILKISSFVSAPKPSNVELTLFPELNYLPSCSHVRPNNLHLSISRWHSTIVFKAFLMSYWLLRKYRIEYLRIFVRREALKEAIFELWKKALWRSDNRWTLWSCTRLLKIPLIYVHVVLDLLIRFKQGIREKYQFSFRLACKVFSARFDILSEVLNVVMQQTNKTQAWNPPGNLK